MVGIHGGHYHNMSLLFPLHCDLFQLHLSLDNQHIYNANVGHILVLQE
jgi:hypothetical protein